MTRGSGVLLSWVAIVALACGGPPDPDACAPPRVEYSVTAIGVPGIDVLLVVDDSASMAAEQAALAAELPRLLAILATGDRDQDGDVVGDGEPNDVDFDPLMRLQLGVVTTDMGAGGVAVPTCDGSLFGGDGILRTTAACETAYPAVFRFDPHATTTLEEAHAQAACMATPGTSGCGFEQPLEAALKALSPLAPTTWTADGYVPPVFFGNTRGHGDGANAELVRDDSLLAIVVLTDEDDCSAQDPALFDDTRPYAETPLDLRCVQHPEALHPIERYVDGLLQLRRRPAQLIFIPIVGVPFELLPSHGAPHDWDTIACEDGAMCDPRLRQELDPDDETRRRASCRWPHGDAYPPTRVMGVARALEERGAHVDVGSVCQESFEGALDAILDAAVPRIHPDCFPHPIARAADGSISCAVTVLVPAGLECSDYPGSEAVVDDGVAVREDGRALCAVPQIVPTDRSRDATPPSERGFYYDDFSALAEASCAGRRIVITTHPPRGTELRLSCDAAAVGGVGVACDPADAASCEGARSLRGASLACDPNTSTCAIACATDDDCAAAGVEHFVCDQTRLSERDERFDDTPRRVCVDPTCG